MLKVLLAEDNSHERILLKNIINQVSDIEIVGEADNSKETIRLAKKHKPNVIFIDINMPDKSGIETAKEILSISPDTHIIFATAHSDYALEAFYVYATDYIVKPFNRDRIKQTLEKIKIANENKNENENENFNHPNKTKLLIRSECKSLVVNISDIIMITKVQRKTIIHTVNDTISTNENLNSFETKLGNTFFSAHRGYLINTEMVSEIIPWGDRTYLIKMSHTKETALMTDNNVKIFKRLYVKN